MIIKVNNRFFPSNVNSKLKAIFRYFKRKLINKGILTENEFPFLHRKGKNNKTTRGRKRTKRNMPPPTLSNLQKTYSNLGIFQERNRLSQFTKLWGSDPLIVY